MTLAVCRTNARLLLKDDFILDSELDTLIRRAERKMERDLVRDGEYKPQQMRNSATITSTVQGVALPSDYQRMRSVWAYTNPMRYVSPEKILPDESVPDVDVTLYYYTKLAQLTDSTSNWLFDLAEDLYMYATALQWVPHQRDVQNAQMWGTYYADAMDSLREATKSQPSGSWIMQKGRPFKGRYTIENGYLRFSSRGRQVSSIPGGTTNAVIWD